jgi:type III secretion protein J
MKQLKWLQRGLLIGLFLVLSGCQVVLYSDLSQQSANVMVATLIRNGVPATREPLEEGMFAVMVEEDDMPRAVEILEREGLPRQEFTSLGQIFAKEGLLSSPTEEKARLVYGISQELSQTISQIDGVLSARIHVVLPEDGPTGRNKSKGSASVFIRHKPDIDLEALTPHIKLLVTKSIANLEYDEVSVINVAARDDYQETGPMLERTLGLWVVREDAPRAKMLFYGLGLTAFFAVIGHIGWLWVWSTGHLAPTPGAKIPGGKIPGGKTRTPMQRSFTS